MEKAHEVVVDGETFRVRGALGQYHYDWVSGPNPDYGFSSGSNVRVAATPEQHREAIRSFLSMIDPATGYIGPDDEDDEDD